VTITGWLQIGIFLVVLTAVTPVLGGYMARVYEGQRVWPSAVLGPVERALYRVLRVAPREEQDWRAPRGRC
jgi:potassium-transporting ATPase potassium-binding subunit